MVTYWQSSTTSIIYIYIFQTINRFTFSIFACPTSCERRSRVSNVNSESLILDLFRIPNEITSRFYIWISSCTSIVVFLIATCCHPRSSQFCPQSFRLFKRRTSNPAPLAHTRLFRSYQRKQPTTKFTFALHSSLCCSGQLPSQDDHTGKDASYRENSPCRLANSCVFILGHWSVRGEGWKETDKVTHWRRPAGHSF